MALEAETDQSVIKSYKYRFSDKFFRYLKHITEKQSPLNDELILTKLV